jgi:hypothetical protein
MSDHIPFITSQQTLTLVKTVYPDAELARMSLDVAEKPTVLPESVKLWIDPGVDGLHDLRNAKADSAWYKLFRDIDGFHEIATPAFKAKPQPVVVRRFVEKLMDRCVKQGPAWITVPQLPLVNDSSRNKLNRELAKSTGKWRSSRGFSGRLVLPLVITHQDQLNSKTQRKLKLQQAELCYHESQADGYWVVDTTLTEETGSEMLRNKRFKSIIALHQELNERVRSRTRIAGPYWGLNLVLWARGLVDYPAIGVGGSYQYYFPGGHSKPASPRIAVGPLRRRVGSAQLNSWLVKALKILGVAHPAYPEIDGILRRLSFLKDPDNARKQVAGFYKNWFDSLAASPQAGRALALFQDLSTAFALGRSLPDFAAEAAARKAASVVEPLMLNCL